MVTYFLFGDPDNFYWNGVYFSTWNFITVYLCKLLINKYRDKLLQIILKIIMGTSVFKLLFSVYSFFDVYAYERINNSHNAGGVIVGCILIFLIYSKNGRMVKK